MPLLRCAHAQMLVFSLNRCHMGTIKYKCWILHRTFLVQIRRSLIRLGFCSMCTKFVRATYIWPLSPPIYSRGFYNCPKHKQVRYVKSTYYLWLIFNNESHCLYKKKEEEKNFIDLYFSAMMEKNWSWYIKIPFFRLMYIHLA